MNRILLAAASAASVLLTPGAAHALWISEVLYDAVGSDAGRGFVELYGAPGTSLAGHRLEGVNGANGAVTPSFEISGVIGPDGFFVIASESGGTTEVANADLLLAFDFQNGPDSIVLRDPDGLVVDALGYGSFGPGEFFAGEGSPAPDPPAGFSLARVFADLDTNDNASDFVALETPTPGAGVAQLPAPRAALLWLPSLCLLVRVCRRRDSSCAPAT
jgi:hypothetical protein